METNEYTRRLDELLATVWADVMPQYRPPTARQQLWRCEDGWVVGYTTSQIEGGPHAGKYAALAYKPVGKGARSANAHEWTRVYFRAFRKRRTARARAETLYEQHRKRTS